MTVETAHAAADRIADYAAECGIDGVQVVLHGGEPLLLGPNRLRELIEVLVAVIGAQTRLELVVQTNGTRLDERFCDLFREYGVRVGVSLDGDRSANDRHRLYSSGASSHAYARRALALLRRPENRPIYGGILCTVDVRNDPLAVYQALVDEQPPRVDFLLPHATWDAPPWRPDGALAPYYAAWLGVIHERWRTDGEKLRIRMFDAIRAAGEGRPSGLEWVGLDPVELAVIETDGSWERADSLKTAYDGAPRTGLNVRTHPITDLLALPAPADDQQGRESLSEICRGCPVVRQCGGGLLAHRYRTGSGFDNPSVYCSDLKELINMVNAASPLPAQSSAYGGIEDIPAQVFDAISAGPAGAAAVAFLVEAQLSITRALLAAVAEDTGMGDVLGVLADLEKSAPAAATEVLRHPYLRIWAVDRLNGRAGADGGVLSWITAAIAARTETNLELAVPVIGRQVHLPTVGTATIDAETATVVVVDGTVTVRSGRHSALLRPARTVRFGERVILLEDEDPFRDSHQWPAAARQSASEIIRWEQLMTEAYRHVAQDAPGYLPGLDTGLRSVVPLRVDTDGRFRSSTSRHAFGSVAVAPAPAAALAVMLVHEFQHNVLSAVLDLVELLHPMNRSLIEVGWRADPRPIEGVLQGAYAHLAVADMWRIRAQRDDNPTAEPQFTQYLGWTRAAIADLLASGALTPTGERFVTGMAGTVATW